MTELGLLLLALYLVEGLRWAPRDSIFWSRRPWGGLRPRSPREWRRGSHAGPLLPEPWLPCLGRLPSHGWPLALSPAGLCVLRGPRAGEALEWSAAAKIGLAGSHLTVDKQRLADAGSAREARALSALIRRLAVAAKEDRHGVIEDALRRRFSAVEARSRIEQWRRASRPGTLLAWAVTLNLAAGPILSALLGWARVVPAWVGLHALLTLLITGFFFAAARWLGDHGPDDRWQQAISMVLYPPSTARFQDALGRDLLAGLDPLAAAPLHAAGLPELARSRLADSERHHGSTSPVRDWYAAELARSVDRLLEAEGLSPEVLRSAPVRESGALSYCPSCRTQYRVGRGTCRDCDETPLTPFA
ncbi:hypothetical protein ABI59_23490 [Acidobacteria bacterium Mor1]|nr:hypothetical protein ABI59_23490 [Acidobacteria bacterium Mor1]